MVKGRWSKEEKDRYQFARMQFGRSWVRIAEYVHTRDATQCRSHGQKSDHKIIETESSAAQTTFYDPRCFAKIDTESSYMDDVDKYFDLGTPDTTEESPMISCYHFGSKVRCKIEPKEVDGFAQYALDVQVKLEDDWSIGMFLSLDGDESPQACAI